MPATRPLEAKPVQEKRECTVRSNFSANYTDYTVRQHRGQRRPESLPRFLRYSLPRAQHRIHGFLSGATSPTRRSERPSYRLSRIGTHPNAWRVHDRQEHLLPTLVVSLTVIAEPALLVERMGATDCRRLVTADPTANIRHVVASQQSNRHVAVVSGDTEPAVVVVALHDAKRQFGG